jgi:hypothetical protein
VPVPVLPFWYFGSVLVLARPITGTGIKWCQYQYWRFGILVQYQYGHGTLPVLALNGAHAGIGKYAFWSSASMAWYITGTGIKWCPYRYWHICTLVQYQYGHGPLPVLALNGDSTGNVNKHYAK